MQQVAPRRIKLKDLTLRKCLSALEEQALQALAEPVLQEAALVALEPLDMLPDSSHLSVGLQLAMPLQAATH